jgi:hypothetical protein
VSHKSSQSLVQGSTFAISPQSGTLEYQASCRPSLNSKKTTSLQQEQLHRRIERDDLGQKQRLKAPIEFRISNDTAKSPVKSGHQEGPPFSLRGQNAI